MPGMQGLQWSSENLIHETNSLNTSHSYSLKLGSLRWGHNPIVLRLFCCCCCCRSCFVAYPSDPPTSRQNDDSIPRPHWSQRLSEVHPQAVVVQILSETRTLGWWYSWQVLTVFTLGLGCALPSRPRIGLSRHRNTSMSSAFNFSKSVGRFWT